MLYEIFDCIITVTILIIVLLIHFTSYSLPNSWSLPPTIHPLLLWVGEGPLGIPPPLAHQISVRLETEPPTKQHTWAEPTSLHICSRCTSWCSCGSQTTGVGGYPKSCWVYVGYVILSIWATLSWPQREDALSEIFNPWSLEPDFIFSRQITEVLQETSSWLMALLQQRSPR
jgi:hypothetical protein